MEKIDKNSRGFSVRETKLDNGQVKLKLAVLPVLKRDQTDANAVVGNDYSIDSLPEHCSISNISVTPSIVSASPNSAPNPICSPHVDRGKWRPIGFTSVEPSPAPPFTDSFSPSSLLSSVNSNTMLMASASEKAPFLSCFGVTTSSTAPFFDSASLKPFQIASTVTGLGPASISTFAPVVNQLYRCAPVNSCHTAASNFKHRIFGNNDRLVSSGSDTDDDNSDNEERNCSPFLSAMQHSSLSPPKLECDKVKPSPKAVSRKKKREIDILLNTWNVAPTAGKLLRQGKASTDSNQRLSRRSVVVVGRKSPVKLLDATKRTPEKSPPPKKSNKVTPKAEDPPKPIVTIEQLEATLSKFIKLTVSPDSKQKTPETVKSGQRTTAKTFKFLPSSDVKTILPRKRFCTSVVSLPSDVIVEPIAQLPPKKRHKQLSPVAASVSKSLPFDAASMSKLVARQSAVIAFLRPSLFDLKREHEDKLRAVAALTNTASATSSNRNSLLKHKAVTSKANPPPPASLPLPKVNDSSLTQATDTDRHPLKLKISLSQIMASRVQNATKSYSELSRGRKARPPCDLNRRSGQTTRVLPTVVSSSPIKCIPSESYGLRMRRTQTAPQPQHECAMPDVDIQQVPSTPPKPRKPAPKRVVQIAIVESNEAETSRKGSSTVLTGSPKKRGRPSLKLDPDFAPETEAVPLKREASRKRMPQKESKDDASLMSVKKSNTSHASVKSSSLQPAKASVSKVDIKEVAVEKAKPEASLKAKRKSASPKKPVKNQAEGKIILKNLKSKKKYQVAGLFSDTFKEERAADSDKDCEKTEFSSEPSSLASPTSEISGGDLFGGFSPLNSPPQSSNCLHTGAVLPLPPPAALSMLYERSYFELPHDLWLQNKFELLNRPTHPGESFRRLRNNLYTASSRQAVGRAETPEPCPCTLKNDKICTDDCINRQLFVECSAESCPSFTKCQNRQFQSGCDAAKILRFETQDCGSGVKAKKPIRKGEFIVEYTGEVVTEREFRRRMADWYANDEHHYAFNLDAGVVIDAYRMGSLARFVNHSCEPNCEMQKWTVLGYPRVGLFALKDLEPGEELAYDYNFNWFDKGSRQVCRCGKPSCRGYIGAAEPRRNSIDAASMKKPIQPLATWRLANVPRPFNFREAQTVATRHVLLARNVRSMSHRLFKLKHRPGVVIAQASSEGLICNNGATNGSSNNGGNSLFVAQFKALATTRSVSTRKLAEAESSSTSKSVDMALFLEQLLTSLMMHRDNAGVQTAKPFITLPRRKQCTAYYDRVPKPIDFSTIERNITTGRYPTFDSFNDDVRLLLDNVRLGGDLLLPQATESNTSTVESVFCELADTYDKLLRDFENEISEMRKLFPSVELEDVVRCICGRLNEEGTMVQCEKCQLWQHTDCVGVNVQAIPDSYSCFACSGKCLLSKEVPLPPGQTPPDAQPNCRYFLTLMTKSGLQVRVDECYIINRQSLPFDVPFCKIDKLYPGIFYVDRLYIDENTNKKFIYGVHLVYPFEVHVDHSKRFFPNEVLATLWYDKLPIEIISRPCCVMDSATFARGRPTSATSEELVFICDNGLDKHAKVMHKLSEPMATVCTKRFCFDHFLVPLRPERTLTAGEIHEKMFATRRMEMAKSIASTEGFSNSPSSNTDHSDEASGSKRPETDVSQSEDKEKVSLCKANISKLSNKRDRLNKIATRLAKVIAINLGEGTPEWLQKTSERADFETVNRTDMLSKVTSSDSAQPVGSEVNTTVMSVIADTKDSLAADTASSERAPSVSVVDNLHDVESEASSADIAAIVLPVIEDHSTTGDGKVDDDKHSRDSFSEQKAVTSDLIESAQPQLGSPRQTAMQFDFYV